MTAEDYSTPPRVVGRDAVFVRHRLKSPQVADSAYIAPTAVLCGDVTVGPHSRVLFGAVVTAEGGPEPSEPVVWCGRLDACRPDRQPRRQRAVFQPVMLTSG